MGVPMMAQPVPQAVGMPKAIDPKAAPPTVAAANGAVMSVTECPVGISVPDGPNAFVDAPVDVGKKGWLPEWNGPGRIWVSADYLYWWVKDGPANAALITTSGTASSGILGAADTRRVFGQDRLITTV